MEIFVQNSFFYSVQFKPSIKTAHYFFGQISPPVLFGI